MNRWGGRQFFEKSLVCCDLQGIFTVSSQNLDAHPNRCFGLTVTCACGTIGTLRCGVEQWQLVGLITRRSQVQVLPPLLKRPRQIRGLCFKGLHATRKSCPCYYRLSHYLLNFFG